jgi:hypothetical protein
MNENYIISLVRSQGDGDSERNLRECGER